MDLHSGVVDAQELGRTGHGVDVKVLALSPLLSMNWNTGLAGSEC